MLRYGHVTVDGQRLHYATEGSGPPLLLIHPPPFDHRIWVAAIPYLSGHFRVIVPDLPGCGASGQAAIDGTPDAWIRLMAALTTALGIVPCAVAGASFGGALALGLAVRHPERVRSLVVIGSPGAQIWPDTMQARLARRARFVPGLLPLVWRLSSRAQVRWMAGSALADRARRDGPAFDAAIGALRTAGGRRQLVRTVRHADDWRFVMRQLHGVRAPTLLLWGEADALYGLLAAERLRHAIPGARLVTLAGAGHLLPAERPLELAAEMRQFLLGRA
jgi:pimeloyl-ACP methyl ester carboxylesterase